MARKAEKEQEAEATQEQSFGIEDDNLQLATTSSTFAIDGTSHQDGTNDSENPQGPYSPLFVPEESPQTPTTIMRGAANHEGAGNTGIVIVAPPVERRWEYQPYMEAPVVKVLKENDDGVEFQYVVKLRDGCKQNVGQVFPDSFTNIIDQHSHVKAITYLVQSPRSPYLMASPGQNISLSS